MTTVAIDKNGNIASDGLAVLGGQVPIQKDAKKVFKFTHEDESFFVGLAGDYSVILEVVEYLEQLLYGDMPESIGFDPEAIMLVKMNEHGDAYLGQVASGGHKVIWMGVGDNAIAIGSGADSAMAAMHVGLSAEEAVGISAKMDIYTGGDITTHHKSELNFLKDVADAYESDAEFLMEEAGAIREGLSSGEVGIEESLDGGVDTEGSIDDNTYEQQHEALDRHRGHLDNLSGIAKIKGMFKGKWHSRP